MYITDTVFWAFSAYIVLVAAFMLLFAHRVGSKGG